MKVINDFFCNDNAVEMYKACSMKTQHHCIQSLQPRDSWRLIRCFCLMQLPHATFKLSAWLLPSASTAHKLLIARVQCHLPSCIDAKGCLVWSKDFVTVHHGKSTGYNDYRMASNIIFCHIDMSLLNLIFCAIGLRFLELVKWSCPTQSMLRLLGVFFEHRVPTSPLFNLFLYQHVRSHMPLIVPSHDLSLSTWMKLNVVGPN